MKTLDEVMTALPPHQRRLIERRAAELMQEAKRAKKRLSKKDDARYQVEDRSSLNK